MRSVALLEAPWREPGDLLSAFADEPWAAGLIGAGPGARWAYVVRAPDRILLLNPDDPRDPFQALRSLLGPDCPAPIRGPPFQGGVIGLASYEFGDRVEPIGLRRLEGWPDLACARYPAVAAFDQTERRAWAIGRGDGETAAAAAASEALSWFEARPLAIGRLDIQAQADDPAVYESKVTEVTARIAAGEIFQANIARRWRAPPSGAGRPFDVFQRLLQTSPAPFAAYLRLPGRTLVSNSPERFVQVEPRRDGLHARTEPIKGTSPRGKTPQEDRRLHEALERSEKDRAENLMIVDLMRNDLARVCLAGAVRVPKLFAVERFANVHHLVSTVTGRLAPGCDAIDLLRAAFPPGSITGAPKIQAMRVIAQLEPPRGPFFGSMFRLGFDGSLDSSVLIRTAAFVQEAGGWSFEARAGAGIVADSRPRAEREETETKISALLAALREA